MSQAGIISSISPRFALPGAEVIIGADGFEAGWDAQACLFDTEEARIIAASSRRVIACVPDVSSGEIDVALASRGVRGNSIKLTVAGTIASDLHNVANPAVDPSDGSIIATRSGSRGFQLPATLFRVNGKGEVGEMAAEVLNPTGLAFSRKGELFVSNRSAGEIYRIVGDLTAVTVASDLGIATGIAFGPDDALYVGDRSGRIYRVSELGLTEIVAAIEPSVAAYHLAFGPDGRLYVTAPSLASHAPIYAVSMDGTVEEFVRGFGRPQGLAFDTEGNLYAAACYEGRHGIVKITSEKAVEHFVAGNNIVGLCFGRSGEMIVATNDSIYSIPIGIHGTLLP